MADLRRPLHQRLIEPCSFCSRAGVKEEQPGSKSALRDPSADAPLAVGQRRL
ncbi:MAG: hypothetical protein N838_19930 [Thiohalocapsa sp. PB-PSB1]|nr:MAG: hypothetical protein N838_19930 [Thiohalocapsa sp. PB-PSB1]